MKQLRLASCMAENTETLCREIAAYLADELGVGTEYVGGISWQERERLFDLGEIQILWLCGLPYVHKADLAESTMELLAVPVPAGERYRDRPVYFSEIVVRRDHPARCFDDLRGAAWAFNEPRSHSGYNVVRAFLAERGEARGFFGPVTASGAHARSLELIRNGQVDGAAVDSTVLEWFARQDRSLMSALRVIDTIGPSPIPPWVISTQLPRALRESVRHALLRLDRDRAGRSLIERAGFVRFVLPDDRAYDPIRRMAARAANVLLGHEAVLSMQPLQLEEVTHGKFGR
jgi:phosphonate transport system substrate-binding protein